MHLTASTLQPQPSFRKLSRPILLFLALAAALPLFSQQRPEMVTQGGGGMEGFMGQHAPVFGPEGRWIVAIGGGGSTQLLVFDRTSRRLARSIETGIAITSVSAHPSQDQVILSGEEQPNTPIVAVYNVITGKPVWKASALNSCFQAQFSSSGTEALAFCSALPYRSKTPLNGSTLRWNAANGSVLPSAPYHSEGWSINTVSEHGEISSSVNPNAADRASKLMNTMRRPARVPIFGGSNTKKGVQARADAENDSIQQISSMDYMASTFLDASTGQTFGSATGMVLAISAKSHTAVLANGTGLVLIDIVTGKPILTLGKFFQQDPAAGFVSAAVSQDGSRYVLGGPAHVTVVDSASGEPERDLADDIPFAMKWAISADNKEVAAAQGNAVMVLNLAQQTHIILGDPSTVMMPGSIIAKTMADESKPTTATLRRRERKVEEDQFAQAEANAHGSSKKEIQKQMDALASKDVADQPQAVEEARNKQDMMNSMAQYMGTVGAVTGFPPAERLLDHARLLAVRSGDGGWSVWDTATGNPLPYRKPLGDLSRYEHAGNNPEEFLDESDLRAIQENLGILPKNSPSSNVLSAPPTADVACSSTSGDHWVEITRNGKKLSGALLRSSDGTSLDLLAKGVDLSTFNPHGFLQSMYAGESKYLPNRKRTINGWGADLPVLCTLSPSGDRLIVEVEKPEAKPGRKTLVDAQHMGTYGGAFYAHSFSDSLVLYSGLDGHRLCELENPFDPAPFDLSSGELVFSSDSKRIAAGGRRRIMGKTEERRPLRIWDGNTCRQIRSVENADSAGPLGFSEDNTFLFTGATVPQAYRSETAYGVHVWNAANGAHLFDLPDALAASSLVVLGPGGKTILAPDQSNALGIWSAADGSRLGMLRALPEGEWLVTSQDGLFDGSPRGWNQIAWRDPDGIKTEPAEVFFTDFYRPGLLAELLDGHQPPLPRNFAQVDRRQPTVVLTAASATTTQRTIQLQIDASEAATGAAGGGVRDVRLFRNGVLIKAWRGNLPLQQGKAVLQTDQSVIAGPNHFTAYAFNHDNVKSIDAETTVQGTAPPRPGTVFLLAVGVNQYSNSEFNLRYAAPDATRMAQALEKSQQKAGRYPEVIRVDLLDTQATKSNVLLALNRLAGQSPGPLPANAPSAFARLRAVQPEDSVMIYFAGHGIAWQDHFYLVPHDLGFTGARSDFAASIDAVLQHSISDVELESSLEPLDASHILLVIDACNSGKALDAEEQRRGPMNSRGLAQLAYEKGIDVLTASQSYQAALESSRLGHGYLTYALAEEGLTLADTTPVDGKVTAPEWFEYATSRVPQLQISALGEGTPTSRQLTFESDPAIQPQSANPPQNAPRLQTPRFYYRRDTLKTENIIATLP